MERLHLQGIGYGVGKTPTGSQITGTKASSGTTTAFGTATASSNDSAGKVDWKQQKEEQAKLRKRQNDLKRIETEIEKLEARNEELDVLLADETIYTDHTKLLEITKEKDAVSERLLSLMEEWELLAE